MPETPNPVWHRTTRCLIRPMQPRSTVEVAIIVALWRGTPPSGVGLNGIDGMCLRAAGAAHASSAICWECAVHTTALLLISFSGQATEIRGGRQWAHATRSQVQRMGVELGVGLAADTVIKTMAKPKLTPPPARFWLTAQTNELG